jgi:calpain-15
MLLEKAWAKLHGSYFRTDGGLTSHAAQHLLGHPTFSIEHSETDLTENTFFTKMLDYHRRGYIMLASSTQNYNNQEIDGIVQNHCYSVYSAVESSTGTKLLKMRNP